MPVGGAEVSREHGSVAKFNSGLRPYIQADCSTVLNALASQETLHCRIVLQKHSKGDMIMGELGMEGNPASHKLLCK